MFTITDFRVYAKYVYFKTGSTISNAQNTKYDSATPYARQRVCYRQFYLRISMAGPVENLNQVHLEFLPRYFLSFEK